MAKKAKWSAGTVKNSVSADGTITSERKLLDDGVLVCTVKFIMTADRALRVEVYNEPGAEGLTNFEAWSNL